MLMYLIRRLNLLVITLFVLSFLIFLVDLRLADQSFTDLRFLSQYQAFLMNILQGDLGISSISGEPVITDLKRVIPATLELCLIAFLVANLIGIPLGLLAGSRHGSRIDQTIMTITLVGYSVPIFWLAILAMLTFSLSLGWFPAAGRISLLYEVEPVTGFMLIDVLLSEHSYRWEAWFNALKHLVLPALVLAVVPTTEVIRQMRNSTAEVMRSRYVQAATMKGLSRPYILMTHGLRNALPPVLPKLGLQFGNAITAAIMTENVFEWPGIGTWLVNAMYNQDYNSLQGGLLVIATLVIVVSISMDIMTVLIDPVRRKELYAQS